MLGCSRIASSSTIPAILQSKFTLLEYLGSRDEYKAESFAKKFKCAKFGTYQDVLNDNNVDAVYISLPVGLHEEWVIKAAKAGKHILCEKSSTVSYKSAQKMVDYCKKQNVRLLEGLMFRFHPSHQKVKQIIKQGKLGKLFSFYGKYGFSQVQFSDIRYNKKLGGGILNDAGCYPVCASRIIFNKEPQSVFYSPIIDKKSGVDVKGILSLKYSNNEFAHMEFGYGLSWVLLFSWPLMAAAQMVSARIGRVTGVGIAGALRHHGYGITLRVMVSLLLIANIINLGADLSAMADATRLLVPVPQWLLVLGFGVFCIWMQVFLQIGRAHV